VTHRPTKPSPFNKDMSINYVFLKTEISDVISEARVAEEQKEGVYNRYGNEQQSQYIITQPTITTLSDSSYVCSSTCVFINPINIVGSGATPADAFDSWVTIVNSYLSSWAPDYLSGIRDFVQHLRTMPKPPTTPYGFIWDLPEAKAVFTFWDTFKQGSFNPFGNGMIMKKEQYEAVNVTRMAGWSNEQRNAAYNKYVKQAQVRGNRAKKPNKGGTNIRVMRSPPKARINSKPAVERPALKLSECAKAYATCLRCPFWWQDGSCNSKVPKSLSDEILPCIPTFPAIKTRKFFFKDKGVLGAPSGAAFIVYAPWRLANDNNLLTNVSPPVLFSKFAVGGVGNQFPVLDTGGAWNNGSANLNSDYTTAQLITTGTGIKYRVVGSAIRVKYIGPELNASGMYCCVEQPDHNTLSNLTLDQIGQLDSFFSISVSTQMRREDPWVYLTYNPVALGDFDFNEDPVANDDWPVQINKNHFMGMLITGIPVGADYFAWEAITHVEAIGSTVTGKSNTIADPIGVAAATNAIKPETQKNLNTNQTVKQALSEGNDDISIATIVKGAANFVQAAAPIVRALIV